MDKALENVKCKEIRLTGKRARFIAEYLIDQNASKAAERAGYSKDTCGQIGFNLLKDVEIQSAIEEAIEDTAQRNKVTVDRILREYAKMAFSDPRSLFNEDGDLKPPNEWDDDAAACVAGFEVTQFVREGAEGGLTRVSKVRRVDKKGALDSLAKWHGMLTDRVEHTGKNGGPIEFVDGLTDTERAAKLGAFLERIRQESP